MQGTLPTSEARRRCSSPSLATLRHSSTSASPRSRRARIFSSCMSRPRNSDACSPRNSLMCCSGQYAELGPERNLEAMPLALPRQGQRYQHAAKVPSHSHHTCSYDCRT